MFASRDVCIYFGKKTWSRLYKVLTRHLNVEVSSRRFLQFSHLMRPLSLTGNIRTNCSCLCCLCLHAVCVQTYLPLENISLTQWQNHQVVRKPAKLQIYIYYHTWFTVSMRRTTLCCGFLCQAMDNGDSFKPAFLRKRF